MIKTVLRGMTWDHPRGLESVVHSNDSLQQACSISVEWQARSLLAFGDQHISDFYKEFDLMIIDHPHVPDAVHAKALLPISDFLSEEQLGVLKRTSVGQSHNSYGYRDKTWALAIDTAAQVTASRADCASGAPVFWSDVFELARSGRVLWAYKPVDAFSTFATICAQLGSPLASTSRFVEIAAAEKALGLMIELAGRVPEFCASSNPIDIAERLVESDQYDFGVCMYGYSNYSHDGFRSKTLIYDDVPSFDGKAGGSQLGGAGIAISSATSDPFQAAIAAYYLSEPAIQSTVYGLNGGQPGNLVAWKNRELNKISNNFFANTLRTLERAWVRPRLLGWPDVQYESSLIIHKCLVDKKFTSSDIDAIERTFNQFIQEA